MEPRPATWIFRPLSRRGRTDLHRPRAGRDPIRKFFLFCEGKKTEPGYFLAVQSAHHSTLIEICSGVGVPMTVAERAAACARKHGLAPRQRKQRDSFEEGDQVWAVFDRDNHPRFDEAVALCESNGVCVARSDPCFELWLILHERDYDRACTRRDVQRELASLRPEYDKGGAKTPDCADLVQRVEESERRAETQLQRRVEEGKPHGNPSTTVGQLTRAIREADAAARPRD